MKLIPITPEIVGVMSQIPPFMELSEGTLSRYAEELDFKAFSAKKGELIVAQGDLCQRLYVLIHGKLRVDTVDPGGESIFIGYTESPEIFAVYPFFSKDNRLLSSFTAVKDVVFLSIGREAFKEILRAHPDLAYDFMSLSCQSLKCRQNRLTVLTRRTIREKIVSYLFLYRTDPGKSKVIHSQTQLADYMSVSRPALSTEVNKLEKEGLIRRELGGIVYFSERLTEYL